MKAIINWLADPAISFTLIILVFFLVFPITDRLEKISKRLKIDLLWTNTGGLIALGVLVLFFVWGLTDENFRLIVTKPDNVPIVGLIFLVGFFTWLSMKQARENDNRMGQGGQPLEASDKSKVLVWPDLIYIEFICLILATVLLFAWSIFVKAPLEEPANPTLSPNPSKAPWYFLGLQEMLVYYDPWLAGIVLPTLIMVGLVAIPYMDTGDRGTGFYSYSGRKRAISTFMFGFLVLWTFLIIVGTFLRGPNWNFFGPFEVWDANKRVVLNNVNLSEYIYVFLLETGLPRGWLIREIWGILLVVGYFAVLPGLLAKTVFRNLYERWGTVRYSTFIVLLLMGMALPIKMYMRWLFNLKYIVSIPEFFLNI